METPDEKPLGEWRVRTIRGWDHVLTWSLKPDNHPYILYQPPVVLDFNVSDPNLFAFDDHFGFFSIYQPLVGMVSDSLKEIEVAAELMDVLPSAIESQEQLHFAADEILSKVVAYRELKKGMKFRIPTMDGSATFVVDMRIDLWRGMPAFGLLPESETDAPPILLFRGTDLTLTTEKGWASILSDLDLSGPGHTTYLRARKEIRKWLAKRVKEERPARTVGFSLGGGFVLYSLFYEHELLSKNPLYPSRAFNPPGVSEKTLATWQSIPPKSQPPHQIFVNQGDVVSKVGYFPSNVWEVTLDKEMEVIEAHVTLISTQPAFHIQKVDVEAENRSR